MKSLSTLLLLTMIVASLGCVQTASTIEEAFSAVSTTIGVDNDMEYRYTVPFELRRPEMLHTLGIAQAPDQAEFIFQIVSREPGSGLEGSASGSPHSIQLEHYTKTTLRPCNTA